MIVRGTAAGPIRPILSAGLASVDRGPCDDPDVGLIGLPRALALLSALACVSALLGGCGGGSPNDEATATTVTTTASIERDETAVFFVAGEQFVEGTREGLDSSSDLKSLVEALIEGPSGDESARDWWTDIPRATTVIRAEVNGGTAEVELSSEFDADAGTAKATRLDSLYLRLGQLVFTATSLPGVDRVVISVPGSDPLTLSRSDFTKPVRREREPAAVEAAGELAAEAPPEPVTPAAAKPVRPAAPAKPAALGTAEIQRRLISLGYLPAGSDDGKAGERTRHAVVAFQGWEGLSRDGVVGPMTAARLKSAARPTPAATGSGRRVEIHRAKGVLLLIEGGAVVRALHTSTGSGGDSPETGTPPGQFRIYRKEARSWSVPFKTWLPWAAYWNAGWAMHEYPDVPAWPASHGCARLPAGEAKLAYEFVSIGTPVRVF